MCMSTLAQKGCAHVHVHAHIPFEANFCILFTHLNFATEQLHLLVFIRIKKQYVYAYTCTQNYTVSPAQFFQKSLQQIMLLPGECILFIHLLISCQLLHFLVFKIRNKKETVINLKKQACLITYVHNVHAKNTSTTCTRTKTYLFTISS